MVWFVLSVPQQDGKMLVDGCTVNDSITGKTMPCHLYFIYADDVSMPQCISTRAHIDRLDVPYAQQETIPDIVLEKTVIHVDLMASEAEPERWSVEAWLILNPPY